MDLVAPPSIVTDRFHTVFKVTHGLSEWFTIVQSVKTGQVLHVTLYQVTQLQYEVKVIAL